MSVRDLCMGLLLGEGGDSGMMKYIVDNSKEIASVPVNETYRFSLRLFLQNDTKINWVPGKQLLLSNSSETIYFPNNAIRVDGDGAISYAFAGNQQGIIAFVCFFENDKPLYAVSTSPHLYHLTAREFASPVDGDMSKLILKYGFDFAYEFDLNNVTLNNFTPEDLTFYNPSNDYFLHEMYIDGDYNSAPSITVPYTGYHFYVVNDPDTGLPDHFEYWGSSSETTTMYFSRWLNPYPSNLLHYDEGMSYAELWGKYMNAVSIINTQYYGKNTRIREEIIPEKPV